jgi:hypothetical protein
VNPSLSLSIWSRQASSPAEFSFGAGVRVGVAVGVEVGVEVDVGVTVGVEVGVGATQLPLIQRSGATHWVSIVQAWQVPPEHTLPQH